MIISDIRAKVVIAIEAKAMRLLMKRLINRKLDKVNRSKLYCFFKRVLLIPNMTLDV